jgi:hypothetical protein
MALNSQVTPLNTIGVSNSTSVAAPILYVAKNCDSFWSAVGESPYPIDYGLPCGPLGNPSTFRNNRHSVTYTAVSPVAWPDVRLADGSTAEAVSTHRGAPTFSSAEECLMIGRIALCAALATSGMSAVAHAGDLTVIEAVWTSSIAGRQYGARVEPDSPARPMYFWTKLAGGPESLAVLRRNGKLPIKHVWQFANVFDSGSSVIDPSQERALAVGQIVDVNGALGDLVDRTGQFTWRTWSKKESVQGGTWTVSVQYADGEPVMCSGKPCQWSIDLEE